MQHKAVLIVQVFTCILATAEGIDILSLSVRVRHLPAKISASVFLIVLRLTTKLYWQISIHTKLAKQSIKRR